MAHLRKEPPVTSAEPSPYYQRVSQATDDLEDALAHVRAEQDAGRLTPAQACAERVRLLEGHLDRCRELRAEYLGTTDAERTVRGYAAQRERHPDQ
jgi:hypothetical protein